MIVRLQRLGLSLFLVGFVFWLVTLTVGEFRLTNTVLVQSVKPEHRDLITQQTAFMRDRTYANNWTFVADFRRAVNTYNDKMRARKAWDKVIYDNYAFDVTRNASLGVLTTRASWGWLALSIGLCTLGGLLYALAGLRLRGAGRNPRRSVPSPVRQEPESLESRARCGARRAGVCRRDDGAGAMDVLHGPRHRIGFFRFVQRPVDLRFLHRLDLRGCSWHGFLPADG